MLTLHVPGGRLGMIRRSFLWSLSCTELLPASPLRHTISLQRAANDDGWAALFFPWHQFACTEGTMEPLLMAHRARWLMDSIFNSVIERDCVWLVSPAKRLPSSVHLWRISSTSQEQDPKQNRVTSRTRLGSVLGVFEVPAAQVEPFVRFFRWFVSCCLESEFFVWIQHGTQDCSRSGRGRILAKRQVALMSILGGDKHTFAWRLRPGSVLELFAFLFVRDADWRVRSRCSEPWDLFGIETAYGPRRCTRWTLILIQRTRRKRNATNCCSTPRRRWRFCGWSWTRAGRGDCVVGTISCSRSVLDGRGCRRLETFRGGGVHEHSRVRVPSLHSGTTLVWPHVSADWMWSGFVCVFQSHDPKKLSRLLLIPFLTRTC